jgi:hypothetical protein
MLFSGPGAIRIGDGVIGVGEEREAELVGEDEIGGDGADVEHVGDAGQGRPGLEVAVELAMRVELQPRASGGRRRVL